MYAVKVNGSTISTNDGKFTATETRMLAPEMGVVTVTGALPKFTIGYTMSSAQVSASKILGDDLFKSGKYSAVGALVINTADGALLDSIPVMIHSQ